MTPDGTRPRRSFAALFIASIDSNGPAYDDEPHPRRGLDRAVGQLGRSREARRPRPP